MRHLKWIDTMKPSDIRAEMQEMLDEGFVKKSDNILQAINPNSYKKTDFGEFAEDQYELQQCLEGRYEWFCNVMRIKQVWEYVSCNNPNFTFHDLDQILLWVFKL